MYANASAIDFNRGFMWEKIWNVTWPSSRDLEKCLVESNDSYCIDCAYDVFVFSMKAVQQKQNKYCIDSMVMSMPNIVLTII